MFQALEPLLAKRSLVLTVTAVGDGRIRVTVNPTPNKSTSEIKDAVVPFIAEGTAKELDDEPAEKIGSYATEHLSLDASLEEARNEMEAARKAAKEEAAKKAAESKKATAKGKFVPPAKPTVTKPEPEAVKAPDLFTAATAAPAVPAAEAIPASEAAMTTDPNPQEVVENGSQSNAA